ncbi:hypothetical protein ABZ470_32255 [Streptosporangium sp. NPDC020072]|uniref:Uncharacterized protein n=1 Tax=Streptosporangium jomthongense TaxID=1193683 RepID=A0ABV8F6C0_9ACTN
MEPLSLADYGLMFIKLLFSGVLPRVDKAPKITVFLPNAPGGNRGSALIV